MTPECILTQLRASGATLVDIFLQVMEALTTGKASLMDNVIPHINDNAAVYFLLMEAKQLDI